MVHFFPFVIHFLKYSGYHLSLHSEHLIALYGIANSRLLPRNAYFAQTSTYFIFGWLKEEDTPMAREGRREKKNWRVEPRLKWGQQQEAERGGES